MVNNQPLRETLINEGINNQGRGEGMLCARLKVNCNMSGQASTNQKKKSQTAKNVLLDLAFRIYLNSCEFPRSSPGAYPWHYGVALINSSSSSLEHVVRRSSLAVKITGCDVQRCASRRPPPSSRLKWVGNNAEGRGDDYLPLAPVR